MMPRDGRRTPFDGGGPAPQPPRAYRLSFCDECGEPRDCRVVPGGAYHGCPHCFISVFIPEEPNERQDR